MVECVNNLLFFIWLIRIMMSKQICGYGLEKEDWGVWCFADKKPGFTNITSLSLSGYLHIYLYMVIIILMSKQKCGSGLEKEDRGVWFLADKKRGFTKITWEKLLRKFFEVSFVVPIKKHGFTMMTWAKNYYGKRKYFLALQFLCFSW